jgi:hypothetical protein
VLTVRLPRCVTPAALAVLACAALAGCGQGPARDVTVGPAAPGPRVDLPTPSWRPPCPADGVRVTSGPVDGAMGVRAVTLFLTNCGGAPFTVSGYPEVGVVGADGEVPLEVVRGFPPGDPVGDAPPGTFVLDAGESAQAPVLWRLLVEGGDTGSVTAPLVVAPGPGRERRRAGVDLDLGTTRKVTVGAWRPGAGPGT